MQSNAARAGLIAVLAAVAVVLFIVLSGDDDSGSDSTETATVTTATGTEAAPEPRPQLLRIELRDGAPVGGVAELEVDKGEMINLVVTSDEDAEFHVHGYEIERELVPGRVMRVTIDADIDGKFEVEAHSHTSGDIPLAELTVQPG